MTFDEAIQAVGAFAGQDVEVRLYGPEAGGHEVATLAGVLARSPEVEFPPGLTDAAGHPVLPLLGDPIPQFTVGAHPLNVVSLSRDRFVSASITESPEGVEVITKDAVIHVMISRPWID